MRIWPGEGEGFVVDVRRYRREKEREIDRRVYSSRLYIMYIIDARIENG